MATSYFYRMFDAEFGPVGFRELVRLVRDGQLGPDDPVKADWEREWHPAAQVIGLFHMAGRDDVLALWEAERQAVEGPDQGALSQNDLEQMWRAEESLPADRDEPAWQRRLREVDGDRRDREADGAAERNEQSPRARSQRAIDETIAAAIEAAEAKDRRRAPGVVRQALGGAFSRDALRLLFRFGVALGAANATAVGILAWSATELQRYPDRELLMAGARTFPYWGACSPAEFLFLLCDSTIVAGLVGYGAARVLDCLAED